MLLWRCIFLFLFSKYLGIGLLCCMFNFLKNCQTFPKLAVSFCIHTINEWVCLLSYLLVSTWYCQLEKTIHLNMGVVVSHCSFNVISLIISDTEHLLMYLFAICVVFGEISDQAVCSVVCCMFFAVRLWEFFMYYGCHLQPLSSMCLQIVLLICEFSYSV